MNVRTIVIAVLVAGCAEFTALENPDGVVVTCDEAFSAQDGADCALAGPCERPLPANPACCTDYAYCTTSGLVVESVCSPDCACEVDTSCSYGEAMCTNSVCAPCPATDACPPCPEGWMPLLRNGCASCECAPPSQCDALGENCSDEQQICYAGASCAAGCDATQPGCCDNVCALPGCTDPAPVGCYTDCPPELGCELCATDHCICDGLRWTCDALCVEDVALDCVHTPTGSQCAEDVDCDFGLAICEASQCEACPSLTACPECPDGWDRLYRNGCATCACGPPSECPFPGELCEGERVCYAGASCAESCSAFQEGCCSNACAAPGCDGPVPVGCAAGCPPELGCELCATDHCICDGAEWTCNVTCVDDVGALIVSCEFFE
jgi:hypothetical protein